MLKFFDEIVMINLLEQLFYNKEIIIAAGDAAVEMAGYCRRKLIQLVVRKDLSQHLENVNEKMKLLTIRQV
ncbi:MAG: hypothetical protein EZS28_047495 [Streblomastix strix]|uniref:Uncharacterized protein n=1 Tax=Streblomastix strix TaxID=222440 RepID=A0A5J4TFH8_9EUKA|nr:MAG: hypothetical protein EZS28_047495 [Streblomastix strix]